MKSQLRLQVANAQEAVSNVTKLWCEVVSGVGQCARDGDIYPLFARGKDVVDRA